MYVHVQTTENSRILKTGLKNYKERVKADVTKELTQLHVLKTFPKWRKPNNKKQRAGK